MTTTIKKVTGKLGRLAYRTLKSPAEVGRMLDTGDSHVIALAEALKVMLSGEFSPQQREWINQIEAVRGALEANPREIVVDDFGSLPPGHKLVRERPLGGRTSVRKVADVAQSCPQRYWCWMLFELVNRFRPAVAVELGTGLGISAAYMAAAMRLNHYGHLYTLEGADTLVELAQHNLTELELPNVDIILGRFQETLERQMRRVSPVDLVFFDGHFEGEATRGYFEQTLPYLSSASLVFFNGITHNDGMGAAWNEIITHERVDISVDLVNTGVCLVTSRKGRHLHYKVVLA